MFRRLQPWSSQEELERTLRQLQRLAHRRRRYREQRGCIDFTFAEARLRVADGHADGVIDSRRCAMEVEFHKLAHSQAEELVMEMMVAAGEVVGLLGKDNVGSQEERHLESGAAVPCAPLQRHSPGGSDERAIYPRSLVAVSFTQWRTRPSRTRC